MAGEIGHVATTAGVPDPDPGETLDLFAASPPETRVCVRCGQPCLEALISIEGMLRYLAERGRKQPNIVGAIAAAHDGDEIVLNAFRGAAHLLGHKLGPIVSALNLAMVVIDAFGDETAFQLIGDALSDGLRHRMTPAAYEQLVVRPAKSGKTAAILGAADLVFDRHLGDWVRDRPPVTMSASGGAVRRGNGS